MKNEKLKYLVEEYKLAEKRLEEIRGKYLKLKSSLEIKQELEKELNSKIKHATYPSLVQYWQGIINEYFKKDMDFPPEKEFEIAKTELEKKEKLIAYYETKIQVIRKLIGTREVELLESFEEKNILMGSEKSFSSYYIELQEKEEELEKLMKDRKNQIGTDKM